MGELMKITKAFKACENGYTIDEYSPGEYESLPPVALEHAQNIGAIATSKAKKQPQNKSAKPESTKWACRLFQVNRLH